MRLRVKIVKAYHKISIERSGMIRQDIHGSSLSLIILKGECANVLPLRGVVKERNVSSHAGIQVIISHTSSNRLHTLCEKELRNLGGFHKFCVLHTARNNCDYRKRCKSIPLNLA